MSSSSTAARTRSTVAARAADEERLARLATRQGAEIDRLRKLADTMRGQSSKRAKTAKSLDTRVSKLRTSQVTGPRKEKHIEVRFPEPPRPGNVVLTVDGLTKGYGGPPVFSDVEFTVGRGERLLVMGLNGAGKTSLMRILAGHTDRGRGDGRARAQASRRATTPRSTKASPPAARCSAT